MIIDKPKKSDPYIYLYNNKNNGGKSLCINGSPTDSICNVLHNCVGWACGRFNHIYNLNSGYDGIKFPKFCVNAEKFIEVAKDYGLEVGNEPKVGAMMVWMRGKTLNGSDGAGHVAVVERVDSSDQVYTSESGWNASPAVWNQTRSKGSGNWGQSSAYTFRGFIYMPIEKPIITAEPILDDNNIINQVGVKKASESAKSFSKSVAGAYHSTANLNVRSGAGTSKAIMITIPKGTKVQCYGYYTSVSTVRWLYIQFIHGNIKYTGFASSRYLAK